VAILGQGLREVMPKMALGAMMQDYKPIFDRFYNGVPVLPRRLDGETVTLEIVTRLEEEELVREAQAVSDMATGHTKTWA
jgi:hypothetical protein